MSGRDPLKILGNPCGILQSFLLWGEILWIDLDGPPVAILGQIYHLYNFPLPVFLEWHDTPTSPTKPNMIGHMAALKKTHGCVQTCRVHYKIFFIKRTLVHFEVPSPKCIWKIRSGCDFSDPAGLVAQVPVKLRIAGGQTGHEDWFNFAWAGLGLQIVCLPKSRCIIRQGCVPANIKSGVAPSLLCHWTRFDSGGDHIVLSSWGGTSAKRFKIRSLDIEFWNSCRLAVNRGFSDFFVATWCWDNKGNNNSLGS